MTASVKGDSLGSEYLPGAPGETQTGKFSIAKDDAVKPERGRIGPFVELMEDLFPKTSIRKWATYWFAHLIQHPDDRLQTVLVLCGEGAQLRDTFAQILLPKVFGAGNVAKTNAGDLESEWEIGIKGKQIIVAEGTAESDAPRLYDSLRKTISGETVRPGAQDVPTQEIKNSGHLIILWNDRSPAHSTKDNRRYAVSSAADKLSPDRVEEIRRWIEDEGAAKVRFYLENVKLDRFDPCGDPPSTDDES